MKKTQFLTLIFFCLCIFLNTVVYAEQWVRINQPSTEVRESLTAVGLHYEHFIFVPVTEVSGRADLGSTQLISEPFAFSIDGDLIDLADAALPNNQWFQTTATEPQFYLLQFSGPVKPDWLNAVKRAGIQLVSPMSPFAWVVWAAPDEMIAISNQDGIRYQGAFYPGMKVQQSNRDLPAIGIPSMALVLKSKSSTTKQRLLALGADVVAEKAFNRNLVALTFRLSGDKYLAAAQLPAVYTIQQISLAAGPRGEMSQQSIVGAYDINNNIQPGYPTWLADTGLDGTGVTVSVVDGGIYQNHPDLGGVVACTGSGDSCADDVDSHGSHVAGAIAGTGLGGSIDGNGFNRGLGVAPGATVVEQLYEPLLSFGGPGGMVAGGMLSIYKDAATSGAQLSNNSWGPTGTPQGYDIPTMEIDMISRDANPDQPGHQPVLAVWSIMNGNGDRNTGSCAPSSLGSPDEAKNLFAVGSTKLQTSGAVQVTDIFDISFNSAHGPACDGRLVPHIVAPGCYTEAPNSSSGYGMQCGTSMASPVISGSVALFWEYYRNQFQAEPSPALVKAVFTAVAQDLVGNSDADGGGLDLAPNRQQGWGRVNLDVVINQANQFWLYDQAFVFAQTGTNWQQTLEPIDPAEPIRMMLVWTDAPGPGTGGTTAAWVNDLDLQVTTDVSSYLGNQFGNDGYAQTGGAADGINNMEAVFLRADQHNGTAITVEVLAANIAANALDPYDSQSGTQQDFALACFNCQEITVINNDIIFEDGFDDFIDLIFADGFE